SLGEVGGRIDAYYYCPHHPEAAEDAYRHPDPPDRKPNPGMLLRAMSDWPVDPARSIMVGDKDRDIEAGRRAGVRALKFEGGNLLAFLADELTPA
ncbi:MAG TPA: HAD-IIIA family hydrolase, partial [Phenylobacterium sp.]|nr:HAD-IIIA family hydrolase [Phenylobacterium sp.]